MDKDKIKGTSFNTKKIKIEEMHNLIDKIISLNDIFLTSFNGYILFEESDKSEYKQLINYLFLKFDMNSTKMVLSKDFRIILSYKCYGHKDVLKLIAFLIYFLNVAYFFQTSSIKFLQYFDVLFKILAKLFKDKIVNEFDICFFIKYFMVLSTFNTNEAFRVGKSIKKMIVFWLALNFFTSFFKEYILDNKIALINDMINFIDSTFLVNNLNIIILSKSTQFLGLLDVIKNDNDPNSYINLFQLISKIYSIQYNLKQHRTIISIINNELSGPKFYSNLAVNSKFLNIMSLSLNNILPIKNGFFFTNQPNSGLKISPIISFPSKGYTIIFSFKCISGNDLPEQTILCLKEQISNTRDKEIKEIEFYKIFIRNNILTIQIHNDAFTLSNFPLKKDQFYIVVIVQNEQSFFGGSKSKLSVIFNNLKDIFQKDMTYPKGKMIKGTIGFYEARQSTSDLRNEKDKSEKEVRLERERFKTVERFHFYGIFGSFFIFEEVFNSELLTKIFELGEDYELLLYRNYNFLNSYDVKKIKIVKAIGGLEHVKIESKLICLVSPKAVFESLLKSNSLIREDYGDFNISNLAVSRRKFEILTNTCIFNVFRFHSNFSNFEGIPYLCYILKCINNQLMNNNGSPPFSQIDIIWLILISILEITFIIILNDTQVGVNNKNIIYLFFHYLSGIIEKVTVTKTIPISIFENMIKYLYLFDNFSEQSELVFYLKIKYCELIFDDRLYDTSDQSIISNLLFSFLRYIETVQTNLISVKTFTKLLNFSKSIFGSDQTLMKKDLKIQISDTIKKFIYISFSEKKIKLILELLNFAIDSRYHYYRCYKLVKIFYMVYSEKEKFQKEFLSELIKMKRHESFILKFYYLLNFFNTQTERYDPPFIENLCGLCIRIIDIFYFKQPEKIINNFNIYKESQKSRFALFNSIVDKMHPIKSNFLTKALLLTIIEKKDINPLEELKTMMDNRNIQLINFQNDVCYISEPMKTIINNLDKFSDVSCMECIVKNLTQIFLNISMKVSKPYYPKNEKESTSFMVLTRKHICEKFFDYILFRENLLQNCDIRNTLSNIIKASINTHSRPFYFNLILNLYTEQFNYSFINDLLNEILSNLIISLKKEAESIAIMFNIINLLFLLNKMIIHSLTKNVYYEILKSEQFFKFYFEFVSLVIQTQIIYYYNKLFKFPGDKIFKTLFEIYFEMNFHLYTITKEEKILKLFEQTFFIKIGSHLNKTKAETVPANLDKYFRLNRTGKNSNIDFKKLKYYDSIFFEERENKINFISMELLTKFIVLFYFFSEKKEFLKKHNSQKEFLMSPKKDLNKAPKIMHSNLLDQEPFDLQLFSKENCTQTLECKLDSKQTEFLQNLIISTCKDITNLFYRSDIFTGQYNLGNNKNIEINNFTQLITNEMFSYYEKNKNCFPIITTVSLETEKEEFNKIIHYFYEVIKHNTILYEKCISSYYKDLELIFLKKREVTTPKEMKQVQTPTFLYLDQEFPQKLNSSEMCFPQFDDDKMIDEIENNLNIILYNTNKSLDKINLAYFFKEKFISDEIFVSVLENGYKELIKKHKSDFILTINDFRKNVYIKVKNHFIIGNTYFRPFVKPIINYSHSKYFEITHSHLKHKIDEIIGNQVKHEIKMNFNIKSEIIYQQSSENITNEGVYTGNLSITNKYILFESNNQKQLLSEDKEGFIFGSLDSDIIYEKKIIVIDYNEVKEILVRRFLLMWQAFEIFLNNGKSYFFNFYKINNCQNAFQIFKKIKKENKYNFLVIKNSAKYFKKMNFCKKWMDGELSNFDYLCILNKYSGRTYQDMNQYPVFPWVLAEYKIPALNLEDRKIFRNLAFPVSIQSETKRRYIMQKYESENDSQVHFRCHYATSPIVSLYLLRLQPFTNCSIKLQNNKFDNADRIFYNMGDTYSVLENLSDNRELTPEFFYCPEFLVNNNLCFIGKRSDNKMVNNIQLPDWANSPVDFIHKHRLALESVSVTESLNLWIDNIFGYNQLIRNKESLNVFPNYTYEQETKLDKIFESYLIKNTDFETINNEIKNMKDIIINFGQTPHKLFEEKHPRKQIQISNKEELLYVAEILSKKKTSNIFFFPKGVKYFNISKNFYYINTTFKEVDIFDKNFKKKSKVRLKVQEKFSVLRKKILNANAKIHINKEKYRIVELKDCKYFVSCGHLDQSIKIYTNENIHDYQLNSIVTSLLKNTDETILYTGQINGKISIWNLSFQQNSTLSLTMKKDFVNHEDAINCILHYERLGVLVTGSDDGTVAIRNLANYEIINFINPKLDAKDNKKYKIIDVKISELNWIYILAYETENFYLFGYTLSGIKFTHHVGLINNFEFTPTLGNLIVGYYDNKISVLYATDLKPIYTKSLHDTHDFFLYYFCSSIESHKPFYLGYGDGNFWRYIIEDDKEKKFFE